MKSNAGGPDTYSTGIMSLIMILPISKVPPAPIPHTALATMRLPILVAREHHSVATDRMAVVPRKSGFLPSASDRRPRNGCEIVDIIMKAVESQDAEWAAPKYEVIAGWEDTMMVVSKKQMNCVASIGENMVQNRAVDKPARNGEDLLGLGSSLAAAASCGCRRFTFSLEIASRVLCLLRPTQWASFISHFFIHFPVNMKVPV